LIGINSIWLVGVEERKFYSERRKPVVYQKEGGGRKEREERDKGTMKRALSV